MAQGPDLVVANAAQVRLIWTLGDNQTGWLNVLGAIKLAGTVINQTLANTLATAIRSQFIGNLQATMPPGTGFSTCGVRDVSAPQQTEYIGTGSAVFGNAAGDALPGGAAVCVSLKTALSGPRHRGRVYLSGFAELANGPFGSIDAGIGTSAVGFVTGVQTALAASGLTLAVISRPSYAKQTTVNVILPGGGTDVQTRSEPARPGEVNAVTSISMRNLVWDSQRRRNGAGGGSTLFAQPIAAAYLDESTGAWVVP